LDEAGTVKISLQTYNSKSLKIIIGDNGIGMNKSKQYAAKSSQHQHLGMQIIQKRLSLLSKKYRTETSINYSEYSPDHKNPGTIVEIIMPFIYTIDD
jgi:sensor histidine kinase YesM